MSYARRQPHCEDSQATWVAKHLQLGSLLWVTCVPVTSTYILDSRDRKCTSPGDELELREKPKMAPFESDPLARLLPRLGGYS